MDQNDAIKKRTKQLYDARSALVHNGMTISKDDEQQIQEYVRKVLLMYWYISLCLNTNEHKKIIEEIQSNEYDKNMMYRSFLICLDNSSFEERSNQILKNTLSQIVDSL